MQPSRSSPETSIEPSFGRHEILDALVAGPRTRPYRRIVWTFALASATHLWLLDAWQPGWWLADALYAAGVALLCWRGGLVGWLLCLAGLALPVAMLRDQLSQSVLLATFSTAAAIALLPRPWRAWRRHRATSRHHELTGTPPHPALEEEHLDEDDLEDGERSESATHRDESPGARDSERRSSPPPPWGRPLEETRTICDAFAATTIAAYALAFLHKLNTDYLDPQVSCAIYGADELLEYWGLTTAPLEEPAVAAAIIGATMVVEAAIPALYLLGQRRLAWLVAAPFHLTMTLTMAPAFAFVMATGHVAFVRDEDVHRVREVFARRGWSLAMFATVATGLSLLAHRAWPEPTMVPREWLLWAAIATLVLAFRPWSSSGPARAWLPVRPARPSTESVARRAANALLVGAFVLHGLLPYTGAQVQRSLAMLSNLRVDEGCWNSLVFDESVRVRDDYVRIDEAYLVRPGHIPDYEEILTGRLWNPVALRQMRRNWCEPRTRPITIRGRWRGRPFSIDDLCADEPLPFEGDGIFGVEIFDDYLRFRKNLPRTCPHACIH